VANSRWSPAKTLVALPAAAALGCLPTADIAARLHGRRRVTDLGDGKPGAANAVRSLGLKTGLMVGAVDVGKGYAIARWARHRGAGPSAVGMLALAPVLGHIFVVGGRGAAPSLGAAFANDTPATCAVCVPILAGTALKKAGAGVMLGACLLPAFSFAGGGRMRALWCATLPGAVAYRRLRGDDGGAALTPGLAWQRFWFDRDAAVDNAGDEASGASA